MNQSFQHSRMCAALMLAFGLAAGGCSKKQESPSPATADQSAAGSSLTEARPVAYVSNQDDGVSVIDLTTMAVTGTIDVGAKGPRGIGITADGKMLVTANKEDGNIALIDTATGKPVKHVAIGKNPEFVRVEGDKAYVSYEPSSRGGPPPKPGEPEAAEVDDDEAEEPARIAIVDLKQGKVLQEIVSGPETEGIEFSADGSKLVVTNEADNTITVHDLTNGTLLKTISTKAHGDRPRGIKAAPDGKSYVSTLEYGNKFMVLDANFDLVRTVDTGKSPYGIAFDRAGKRIYVATSKDKLLQVYDATTYEKIKEVPTGDRCWHFTFTPDDRQILLACGRSDELLVIDAEKLEVSGHIADKAMPWGIVTFPKSAGSLDRPQ